MATSDVCNRCGTIIDRSGEMGSLQAEAGSMPVRRLTAAICPSCFSDLLGWLLDGMAKSPKLEARREKYTR